MIKTVTYNNRFDLTVEAISQLEIKENYTQDNCLISLASDYSKFYSSFILNQNTQTITLCEVSFHKSNITNKYLPRLVFRKEKKDNTDKTVGETKPIIISFSKSEESLIFWKLIGFLNSFKDIVELGEFEKSFQVSSKKENYIIEFKNKKDQEKIEDLKELILKADLNEQGIKSLVFENRKKTVKWFLKLLKDLPHKGTTSREYYRNAAELPDGEECIWHHFFKNNDWVLGLNVDVKFITDFYNEQKIGNENSLAQGSPKTDFLGISEYTTLIELKHTSTNIFKTQKSKSRANTWDFTSDFIEGLSQCLAQKVALEKSYTGKEFINHNKERLDKNRVHTVDPKIVLIIGNRRREFPHDLNNDNHIKSETFELFRRNNRNIDIVTYDELFERAYHIVYSNKISKDWHSNESFSLP